MRPPRGPSALALAVRFGVLLGLISQAGWIVLRQWLNGRGVWRADPARLLGAQQRLAVRFVHSRHPMDVGLKL